jgi:hypothetical protein
MAPLVMMRVVSALTCLPAFFISRVPAFALSAAIVALTVFGAVLVARPSRLDAQRSRSALAGPARAVGHLPLALHFVERTHLRHCWQPSPCQVP